MQLSVCFLLYLFTLTMGVLAEDDLMFPSGSTPGGKCDDCFSKHTFNSPIMFSCKPYKHVFVNENGVLSIRRDFWHFLPEDLPLTSETDPNMAIIAAFWTDHNIEDGGKIWTRMASDTELGTLSSHVQDSFDGFTVATDALIATFENVVPYCAEEFPDKKNTYQAILMTNGADSYVMLNYQSLEWNAACSTEYAVVGFNSGDGNALMLPDSGTEDVDQLAQGSNVGLKGRYIYRVSGPTVNNASQPNDKCSVKSVSSLDCVCAHASAVPPSLTSYDGLKLAITRPQKTVLSQWGNGTKDPCKFAIVARSFDTYNDKSVRLFVEWMAINIGLFSKSHRTDKFARSYQVKHGNVYVRGQNTKDEDGPLSLPHNWLSDDESTDIMITKEGKKVFFRSTRCPYGLDVKQSGRITKSYRIYTGDQFQDGKMDGMCADCNGNEEDDMRKCGGLGTASGDDDVTQSCEKAYLMMVG